MPSKTEPETKKNGPDVPSQPQVSWPSPESTPSKTMEALQRQAREVTAAPKTPSDNLANLLAQVVNQAREQQLSAEKQLQSQLSQASATISDAKKLQAILQTAQTLEKNLQGGLTAAWQKPEETDTTLRALEQEIAEQQVQADARLAQALTQAVASLAQAQSAMFQVQALGQMAQAIKEASQALNQAMPPTGPNQLQ